MASFWEKNRQRGRGWVSRLACAVRRPLHPLCAMFSCTALVTLVSLTLLLVGFNLLGGDPAPIDTFASAAYSEKYLPDAEQTANYIQRLDVAWFEKHGTNFANPNFSPARLGIPLSKLDIMVDYDFERVTQIRRRLKGVDRKRVLRYIFDEVTQGARSNTAKHLAVLRFLHKASFHNGRLQPLEREGGSVTDPLVVLELGEMHCGNVSRLAVDLFDSAGIKGRLVQAAGHLLAELYYDNAWHYFDGDIFGNGETVTKEDGTIPSMVELSRDPDKIDALAHFRELEFGGNPTYGSVPYPSWGYFGRSAYSLKEEQPAYHTKTADEIQEADKYAGWNYKRMIVDKERDLYSFERFFQPGAVAFAKVQVDAPSVGGTNVHIEWSEALDEDHDLQGYKVFVSHHSRGWAYGTYTGPEQTKQYLSQPVEWKPDMYDKLFQPPPSEVALVTTKAQSVDLSLAQGDYFITVMPYDKHGEAVGKVLYQMSDEIRVSPTTLHVRG